jgi:SAM-dependent methyltransferase
MTLDPHSEENRKLWDEWARIHSTSPAAAEFYRLDEFKAGASKVREYEVADVGPVEGKRLLHLQCHIGLDTLSWARLGADVTGIDFSTDAIATARRLADELGIPARFVHSDVQSLTEVLDEPASFDVVYTSRGVIGWLPDLVGWARTIAHFLKPGGIFYITEGHPFMWVFEDEDESLKPGELRVAYKYFTQAEPLSYDVVGTYADPKAEVEQRRGHSWYHPLGEVVTVLADEGLRIELLREEPFLEWPAPYTVKGEGDRWVLPEDAPGEIPLMFTLKASKPLA